MPNTRIFQAGFTLLEILVVMVIVGFLAGVVTPRLYLAAQRIEIAAQRTRILTELAALGYRAYAYGQAIELPVILPRQSVPAGFPLEVPSGWQIQIPKPIRYSFNGICSGGSITLINPDKLREDLELRAPQCRVNSGTSPS